MGAKENRKNQTPCAGTKILDVVVGLSKSGAFFEMPR